MIQQRLDSAESSLLLTLEEISRLVSHSRDAAETLQNIVQLIQGRYESDVCSVYLWKPDEAQLVLGATVGLKPDCVGCVRMGLHEGLTGLVAEQLAPVMAADAFQHPRFKYFPEADEDAYHSFLGVPLVERGLLQGVLVVQTVALRTYTRDEIRMLVTVASQLAPLVSEAEFLGQVTTAAAVAPTPAENRVVAPAPTEWHGSPLSPGVGRGEVYFVHHLENLSELENTPEDNAHLPGTAEEEAERLRQALVAARTEIAELGARLASLLGDDQGVILQGQLMILQDRHIESELTDLVKSGQAAERAVRNTLQKYAAVFERLTNSYFRERIYDIKDVFRRVLWHLRPPRADASPEGNRLVLAAQEVSVMDLLSVDPGRLAGVVVEQGGPQSHAAILARSLGIPMVGMVRLPLERGTSQFVTVDGTAGSVRVGVVIESPTCPAIPCERRPADQTSPAGVPRVEANLNLPFEVATAVEAGAGGVGLFRSEFLFMARRTLPTEEEQVRIYRKLIQGLQGRPVSIRTFDLRPDKIARWSRIEAGEGEGLDWRLVLDTPPMQNLFRDQVRAILRAATVGPTRILVPFVNSTEQLDFVVHTVDAARDELYRDGWEFSRDVPLGIMIESAAAAEMVKTWAPLVDFFCLGTNDLVASALALDRDDAATHRLHDPLHPGVLRLIHSTVMAAHYAGRPMTVCGEMAGDPTAACVLASLQVDALSVAVNRIQTVKQALRQQFLDGPPLAPQLTGLRTADAVQQAMSRIRSHVG